MIVSRPVRPVYPMQLARLSGVTRSFQTSTTDFPSRVIYRPYTLQGFIDDVGTLIGEATTAINKVDDTASQIERTASGGGSIVDVVPYQNAVFNGVIVPISNVVDGANASKLTSQELQAMLDSLNNAQQKWATFIHSYPWATTQAKQRALNGEATLAPYWDIYRNKISTLLQTADYSILEAMTGVKNVPTPSSPSYPGQSVPGSPTYTGPVQTAQSNTAGFSQLVPVGLGLLALWYFSRNKKGVF